MDNNTMNAKNQNSGNKGWKLIGSFIVKVFVFLTIVVLVSNVFGVSGDYTKEEYDALKSENTEISGKIETQKSVLSEQEALLKTGGYKTYTARIAEEERLLAAKIAEEARIAAEKAAAEAKLAAEKAAAEAKLAAEKAAAEAKLAAEKAAEQEYVGVVTLYTQIIATYLTTFGNLMTNYDLFSSSWNDKVQEAMTGVVDNCDGLSTVSAPTKYTKVQKYLNQACVYYSKAMAATSNGLRDFDVDELNTATSYLISGNKYVNLATAEIEKLFK